MSQIKFPKRKSGRKRKIQAYQKLLYKKVLFYKKKRKKRTFYKKGSNRKMGRGIFSRKNFEIFGTICLLSLAVVVFGHVVRWNPTARKEPNVVQQKLSTSEDYQILPAESGPCGRPEIIQDFIVENPYSRSGTPLDAVNGIVVHYVANAGSTAEENRNYFENLKDTHETKASSNFVVGIEGEIVQCVPTWEVAYASNSRNIDTVSIECCHPDETGKFTDATYRSVVNLCAWLCMKFDLGADDVIRHYDVTGKECPKYFVDHEDAWENFRQDVKETLARQQNY